MNTALIKHDLLQSLKDREFREAFQLENVYTNICFQIRALREQRGKSQKQLGRMIKPIMAQERISILEDPNAKTKPTLATLLRIADAFDVGLEVRFIPFSTVLQRSTETDMMGLQVKSFDEELANLEAQLESELRAAARKEQQEDALVAALGSSAGAEVYGSEIFARKQQAMSAALVHGGDRDENRFDFISQGHRVRGRERFEPARQGVLPALGASAGTALRVSQISAISR